MKERLAAAKKGRTIAGPGDPEDEEPDEPAPNEGR
jgi:hypothetical protein